MTFKLPTLDNLQATVPADVDVNQVAKEWFHTFTLNVESKNVDGITELFVEESYWRDVLALTWDFRTFAGASRIKKFLADRLIMAKMQSLKLKEGTTMLVEPFPDIAWIQSNFDFETDVGIGLGIVRLVPTANGLWKAHCMFTNLEDLKGHPEKIGALRNHEPNHGLWVEQRRREAEFGDAEPTVLIIGGGHSALSLAARLKVLDVSTLVVERNARIGDNWRFRYEALCLHDPVWYDHMPYLPFPPTWPVYTPAAKLADWLESYAHSLELNVWTSANVTHASHDPSNNKWAVTIKRADGRERIYHTTHLVFATGLGSGKPNMPAYPGMEEFGGQIMHSSEHKKATDHVGKKVTVIGSCTSGHDIATDYSNHGIDVTMFQRGPTYVMSTKNGWKHMMEGVYSEGGLPTDVADRLNASFPNLMQGLNQRKVKDIAADDKDILDGLRRRGFKLSMGDKDAGPMVLYWERGGGYYLDVGGSQQIIDGKIKLKSDSQIERFTRNGLKFEDGSELAADVVVFATGFGDCRNAIRSLCGDKIAEKCKPIWGLNEEGESNGVWRDLGIPGLWYMFGNFAFSRFHSKHVALQIKAMEEKIFGVRYE